MTSTVHALRLCRVLVALTGLLAIAAATGTAAGAAPQRPGSVLLGFEPGTTAAEQRAIEAEVPGERLERLLSAADVDAAEQVATGPAAADRVDAIGPLVRLRVAGGSEGRVISRLERLDGVRFAEPDYVMQSSAVPDDPSFGLQWPLQNTGQTLNGSSGLAGADEHVASAWNVTTGSPDVVIGEVDSGVDYNHPDLAANIWANPGGIGGCPAGTHGVNVKGASVTCDPMDDEVKYGGHGTHVAGILGAVGDNGIGVSGVNWSTTILPVKFTGSNGTGSTSDLIEGLQWLLAAKQAGVNVRVVNDSQTYVGTAYSQALSDEIDVLGANDILFVTAAGNTADDNDDPALRRYPCGYNRATEICVTATTQTDKLASFANYGDQTVDLAAPGRNVYSTLRGGTYGYVSGGSMASPEVAGAAALILSTGYQSAIQLKASILDNVDPLPALAGKVRTGGRLDVCAALPGCNPDTDGDGIADASDACPTTAGGGSADGCPQIARTITLAYGAGRFSGSISAPGVSACAAKRTVTLWNSVPGPDIKKATTKSLADGSFSIACTPSPGAYYAKANPATITGVADCLLATSPILTVG
jgi:subtilisin family serine protease